MTGPIYADTIPAAAHGGQFPKDPPPFIVIHSTEGPMSDGNARALAQWFAKTTAEGGPGTSATDIFDPVEGIRMLDDHTIPYHVGGAGNPKGKGSEHCGSVDLTTDQWLSDRGKAMLDRSARANAEEARHRGWTLDQCRWLTVTQVAAYTAGFCTHNDIRLALGGTTHTDPGPNFPYSWYMDRVRAWYQDPANGGDDDMAWSSWPQADRDALVAAVTAAVIRAVTRGEMPDGTTPPHLAAASTGKITELVKILQFGDGVGVPAESDTHAPNLKTLTSQVAALTPPADPVDPPADPPVDPPPVA